MKITLNGVHYVPLSPLGTWRADDGTYADPQLSAALAMIVDAQAMTENAFADKERHAHRAALMHRRAQEAEARDSVIAVRKAETTALNLRHCADNLTVALRKTMREYAIVTTAYELREAEIVRQRDEQRQYLVTHDRSWRALWDSRKAARDERNIWQQLTERAQALLSRGLGLNWHDKDRAETAGQVTAWLADCADAQVKATAARATIVEQTAQELAYGTPEPKL